MNGRTFALWATTTASMMLFASCGDGTKTSAKTTQPGALCMSDAPPAACGTACSAENTCPLGFYCSADNTCTADCNVADGSGCAEGQACFVNGKCGTPGSDDGGTTICANVELKATTKTPNVVLVLDQSGSMTTTDFKDENNANISRWDVMKNLLIGTSTERAGAGGGFVYDYRNSVRFSLAMYAGTPMCPNLLPDPFVQPMLNAYSAITGVFGPAAPLSGTPTGESIAAVTAKLPAVTPGGDPTILLLATDGAPDTCAIPNPSGGQNATVQQVAVDAVKAAFTKGIETFVIAISSSPPEAHMQDMANAGVGVTLPTKAPYYRVTERAQLAAAFDAIIGAQISCDAEFNGTVTPAKACTGPVKINDDPMPLTCNHMDGWKLLDEKHLSIQGAACTRLKAAGSAASINAVFPCDAATAVAQ